ncbi:hypothetical protein ACOYR4_15460 [Acidovorax sp. M14]|uniref:hypothetical protein n=1 Tax=Acidovorax sp. M14 TaxID=3411354 RepID=UPI003BF535E6
MADTNDFTIDQGSDEFLSFDFDPSDLTGCTARFQARTSYDSKSPVISGDETDMITITGSTLQVHFPADITSAIKFAGESLELVYDMEVVWPGTNYVERFAQGKITISREVTR